MPRPDPLPDLKKLRAYRNAPERDLGIGGVARDAAAEVKRQYRAVGGLGEAWSAIVPADLAARAELVRLSRGVLTVRVTDAAARFAIDRFLRSGGEAAIAQASKTAVKRIKLV